MNRALFSLSNCRWVPWAIAGSFLIVFGVNGALAYFALKSDTGLVSEHPFELGNGYNRVLQEAAAEDALGWRGAATFSPAHGLTGSIIATLHDASDLPLAGLSVTATVVRPVEPLPPQVLTLDATGRGEYAAPITLLRPGQWELRITAKRGSDMFQFVRRVVVR